MTDLYTVKVDVSEEDVRGNLIYCLLTDAIVIENECVPVYGVSVAFEREGEITLEKIHNVTSDREKMQELIERMGEGLVFPVGLRDIIDDFIA